MGDKDGALEEADYVITKAEAGVAPFDLTEEPIVAFNRNAEQQYTVDPVSKEVMFECAFTESNQGNNVAIPLARMCKTGIYNFKSKTFDASNKLYVGSCITENGLFVWHIFIDYSKSENIILPGVDL